MAKFLDDNGLLYLWSKIKAAIPTKVSQLSNDSNFITIADVPEGAAASTTTPKMNDTAAVGTEKAFARGDHVHPKDTSKADKATTYTKTEVDTAVNAKATKATTLAGYNIGDAYTKTEVDTAVGAKATKATSLSGYGITDAYTKTEIDAKLTSAVRYKGTKTNYSQLPTSGNVTGDMWNITNADATHGINAGDNVVWNGTAWDVQAGTVDLSSYVKNTDLISNSDIDTIVAT